MEAQADGTSGATGPASNWKRFWVKAPEEKKEAMREKDKNRKKEAREKESQEKYEARLAKQREIAARNREKRKNAPQ